MIRKDLDSDLFVLVFLSAVQDILTPQTLAELPVSALQAFQGILKIIFEGALTADARATMHMSGQFLTEFSTKR
jgi:hypothetical protein